MRALIVIACLALAACGNTDVDMEIIGQAKKMSNTTNVLCSNYMSFDLSLGVMRNGTGSISKEDVWFTIDKSRFKDFSLLKKAVADAAIVKVTANRRRIPICTEQYVLTAAELVK